VSGPRELGGIDVSVAAGQEHGVAALHYFQDFEFHDFG